MLRRPPSPTLTAAPFPYTTLFRSKTPRSIAGISEGAAGAQEMIEPCPQRRGHAEVVHRCGDEDRVRRREFGVVAGRKRDRTRLSGASLVGWDGLAADEILVDMRRRKIGRTHV